LRNRIPIGLGGITPEEAYSGKKLYIEYLRAFGYIIYTYIPKERRQKLDPNTKKIVLIDYIPIARQYRLYDLVANKVVLAIVPIFDESKYIRLSEFNSTSKPEVQIESELSEGDTIIMDISYLYISRSSEIESSEDPEAAESEGSDSSELEELSNQESEGLEAPELEGNSIADSIEI
jgi:hypothetical protein